VGFRASSSAPENVGTNATILVNFPEVLDHSNCYNNGVFTAPQDGIYSFYVSYDYHIQQTLLIYLDGNPFEYFYGSGTTVDLSNFAGRVSDSGEGRWTVFEAIDLNIAAPVIGLSLMGRIESRDEIEFADRLLASMRNGFGGHSITSEKAIDNG